MRVHEIVAEIVGSFVQPLLQHATDAALRRRRPRRATAADAVPSTLRVVEGALGHLGREWRRGNVELSPGLLKTYFGAVPIERLETARTLSLRESMRLSTGASVVLRVTSTECVLEWALPGRLLPELRAMLERDDASTVSPPAR